MASKQSNIMPRHEWEMSTAAPHQLPGRNPGYKWNSGQPATAIPGGPDLVRDIKEAARMKRETKFNKFVKYVKSKEGAPDMKSTEGLLAMLQGWQRGRYSKAPHVPRSKWHPRMLEAKMPQEPVSPGQQTFDKLTTQRKTVTETQPEPKEIHGVAEAEWDDLLSGLDEVVEPVRERESVYGIAGLPGVRAEDFEAVTGIQAAKLDPTRQVNREVLESKCGQAIPVRHNVVPEAGEKPELRAKPVRRIRSYRKKEVTFQPTPGRSVKDEMLEIQKFLDELTPRTSSESGPARLEVSRCSIHLERKPTKAKKPRKPQLGSLETVIHLSTSRTVTEPRNSSDVIDIVDECVRDEMKTKVMHSVTHGSEFKTYSSWTKHGKTTVAVLCEPTPRKRRSSSGCPAKRSMAMGLALAGGYGSALSHHAATFSPPNSEAGHGRNLYWQTAPQAQPMAAYHSLPVSPIQQQQFMPSPTSSISSSPPVPGSSDAATKKELAHAKNELDLLKHQLRIMTKERDTFKQSAKMFQELAANLQDEVQQQRVERSGWGTFWGNKFDNQSGSNSSARSRSSTPGLS